jgi:phosphoinositide-3-kinase regulatory subunit 4
MQKAWSFDIPAHYGYISAQTLDPNGNWMCTGTHRGVLTLWDIRFRLNVSSWQHASMGAITCMDNFMISADGKYIPNGNRSICIAIDNFASEISVWELDTGKCRNVWLAKGEDNSDNQQIIERYYENGLEPLPVPTSNLMLANLNSGKLLFPKRFNQNVFYVSPTLNCMISGGIDRRLRFHDISSPEKSFVFCGLNSSPPPTYRYYFT